MDKGIRISVNRKFGELLPQRAALSDTGFRKAVMQFAMEEFSITLASASTHYNHALIKAKKEAATDAALATLLQGLGRPEDKKGGRKPKQVAIVPQAQEPEGVVSEVLQSTLLNPEKQEAGADEPGPQVQEPEATVPEVPAAVETPASAAKPKRIRNRK